ncbi:MAG: hypothetical protein PHY45_15515 [Rhodocyclaceae bacterium]|nr:hypothetical protein [Rhodocyclaceae bacterium]
MRSMCRRALIALSVLCCGPACAAPYPTADQLRAAIGVAAAQAKAEDLTLEMRDARTAGVTLPLMAAGLDLTSGVCQVFYNPMPEDGLKRFFAGIPDKDLPVWLDAIAVHEATHCVEQREVYIRRHFDRVLPPEIKGDGMTVQGYLGVVKSGAVETWGEALADIASVLYLQQAVPDQWVNFAQGIIAMRHDLAGKWPSHDTSPWLKKLIAAHDDRPPPENCFEAAFQLRRLYRPQ